MATMAFTPSHCSPQLRALVLLLVTVAGSGFRTHATFAQAPAPAASTPIPARLATQTFWYGNTWPATARTQVGHSRLYVQNVIFDLKLHAPTGRIFTNSVWDEASSEGGIYTTDGDKFGNPNEPNAGNVSMHMHGNGGFAVAVHDQYVFLAIARRDRDKERIYEYSGVARYFPDARPAPWKEGWDEGNNRLPVTWGTRDDRPTGLAVHENTLFVSVPSARSIRMFDVHAMTPRGEMKIAGVPGQMVVDRAGVLWVIDRTQNHVLRMRRDGASTGPPITDVKVPVDVALDEQGRLLVADNGVDRQQIRTYDPTTGLLLDTFGSPIYALEPRGLVAPGRFFGLTAIDVDPNSGDLFVATNGQVGQQPNDIAHGTTLQKFDRNRQLLWTRIASEFVTIGDFDPTPSTNAVQRIFTGQAIMELDLRSPAPSAWKRVAVTIDPLRFPDDPRLHWPGNWSAKVVRPTRDGQSHLLLALTRQRGGQLAIYRFDHHIAVPAAYFDDDTTKLFPPHHPASTLSHTWDGDAGDYPLAVEYRDESDGTAWMNLRIDGRDIDTWRLSAQSDAFETRRVTSVKLSCGSVVELRAARHAGEMASVRSLQIGQRLIAAPSMDMKHFTRGSVEGVPVATTSSSGGPYVWIDGFHDQQRDGRFQPQEFTWLDPRGAGLSGRAHDIDEQGNLWFSGPGAQIVLLRLERFDDAGVPVYSRALEKFPKPARVADLHRLNYDVASDRMIILSIQESKPSRAIELQCYEQWSQRPGTLAWATALPYRDSPGGGTAAADVEPVALTVEGDYIFIAYEKGLDAKTAGQVLVKRLHDGQDLGVIEPSAAVHHGGWVDANYAIQARRLADGSYLIAVEDDGFAKTLVHVWKPTPPEK